MTKVMRKEARHTQRQDRASGVPYNYLQDYVYEIVSSYDFIESPDECAVKIADAFKRYTKKYYTDKKIVYFEDYSIEKVIELSEVSKKWNEKFRLADASKEEFLKLPICKKVKDIIDAMLTT